MNRITQQNINDPYVVLALTVLLEAKNHHDQMWTDFCIHNHTADNHDSVGVASWVGDWMVAR